MLKRYIYIHRIIIINISMENIHQHRTQQHNNDEGKFQLISSN